MKTYIAAIVAILIGTNNICLAQKYKYTPKHFVWKNDTAEFKAIRPTKDGFSRIYRELNLVEYWDIDDEQSKKVMGYTDALICIEGNIKNGKRNGALYSYLIDSADHSKRYKIAQQTYLNNQLNGPWIKYYLNGLTAVISNYSNDSLQGISNVFQIDGKTVEEEIDYFNGSRNYLQKTYFKSGKLEKMVPYKNGVIHGEVQEYYPNGKLKTVFTAVNNKENGLLKRYYESGSLEEELNMLEGKFHGIRKYYHSNGQLWSVEEYKDGKPWNAIANYSDKGTKRPGGTLKNGTGTLIYYDENGSISGVMTYLNGLMQQ